MGSANDDSDDDDDEQEGGDGPGHADSNTHVRVIGPEGEQAETQTTTQAPSVAKNRNWGDMLATLKDEKRTQLRENESAPIPSALNGNLTESSGKVMESPTEMEEPELMLEEDNSDLLNIPGSFDLCGPPQPHVPGETWRDLLRRLTN
jgi:hypothetical protein